MKPKKHAVILYTSACCALLLLSALGIGKPIGEKGAATIFFLETGHILQTQPTHPKEPEETEPPAPQQEATEPEPTQPERLPLFTEEDAALVQLQNLCGYDTDVPAWLAQPLNWQLQQTQPTVLILHSHGTESYADTKVDNYHSLNRDKNVVSVGTELTRLLEEAGIGVVHDTAMHDNPSYDNAYPNSRGSVLGYLEQYPSIRLILDLHRDSVADSSGSQIRFTKETERGTAAKMMFVVGSDASGQSHEKWPENMSLAVKLQALLEKENPGLCRPIYFRTQRFNQDLSPGAMLVEMGSAGNTRQEVLLSAQYLAEAIIALSKGTE